MAKSWSLHAPAGLEGIVFGRRRITNDQSKAEHSPILLKRCEEPKSISFIELPKFKDNNEVEYGTADL